MKVKYIPLAKARELLSSASEKRELSDIQLSALNHAKKFSKLPADKADKLMGKLTSMGLQEIVSAKIVDIMPATMDELRTVVYPYIQTLDPDAGNKILEQLNKLR